MNVESTNEVYRKAFELYKAEGGDKAVELIRKELGDEAAEKALEEIKAMEALGEAAKATEVKE